MIPKRNALITGATGAIGFEIAKVLLKHEYNLFISGTNSIKLSNNIEYLRNVGPGEVFGTLCDLKHTENVYSLISAANEKYKIFDVLVNSAGIFPQKSFLDISDLEINSIFNVNILSPFIITREIAKEMKKKNWGRIVNIGSSSSYSGFSGGSLYCATKHALLGFSRALHEELKHHNIRSFCISPSSTKSKMGEDTIGQDYTTFLDASDIAKYVAFAISFDSNIVTEEIFLKRMIVK